MKNIFEIIDYDYATKHCLNKWKKIQIFGLTIANYGFAYKKCYHVKDYL